MRVVEEERVESGDGLGRKVLATESTDSTEGRLQSFVPYGEGEDRGSDLWGSAPRWDVPSLSSDQLLHEVLWLREDRIILDYWC